MTFITITGQCTCLHWSSGVLVWFGYTRMSSSVIICNLDETSIQYMSPKTGLIYVFSKWQKKLLISHQILSLSRQQIFMNWAGAASYHSYVLAPAPVELYFQPQCRRKMNQDIWWGKKDYWWISTKKELPFLLGLDKTSLVSWHN